MKSTVDIPVRAGESSKYIERLKAGLDKVLVDFKPDICIFVQGSDPYEKDVNTNSRYMKLTLEQLKERDEYVINTCMDKGNSDCPVLRWRILS